MPYKNSDKYYENRRRWYKTESGQACRRRWYETHKAELQEKAKQRKEELARIGCADCGTKDPDILADTKLGVLCYNCHRKRQPVKYLGKNGKTRRRIAELKASIGCRDCNEQHPSALCFHHRDPNTKLGDIADISKTSLTKAIEEIKKCDIVCANCHAKHHLHEGVKKRRRGPNQKYLTAAELAERRRLNPRPKKSTATQNPQKHRCQCGMYLSEYAHKVGHDCSNPGTKWSRKGQPQRDAEVWGSLLAAATCGQTAPKIVTPTEAPAIPMPKEPFSGE